MLSCIQDDVDAKLIVLHPGGHPFGNEAHRAPELLDAVRRLSQRGAAAESVCVGGQAVFEMGVLMFELMFKKHPLGECDPSSAPYMLYGHLVPVVLAALGSIEHISRIFTLDCVRVSVLRVV